MSNVRATLLVKEEIIIEALDQQYSEEAKDLFLNGSEYEIVGDGSENGVSRKFVKVVLTKEDYGRIKEIAAWEEERGIEPDINVTEYEVEDLPDPL